MTTTAFADGGEIPAKYVGMDGVSPKFEWTNVPMGTVTLALIMHDSDVALQRRADDVLHWLAFNIPRGAPGYTGPGAPPGPHHHDTWELYALDTKLDLGVDATRADVLRAIGGHILGKGVLVGRFHR